MFLAVGHENSVRFWRHSIEQRIHCYALGTDEILVCLEKRAKGLVATDCEYVMAGQPDDRACCEEFAIGQMRLLNGTSTVEVERRSGHACARKVAAHFAPGLPGRSKAREELSGVVPHFVGAEPIGWPRLCFH